MSSSAPQPPLIAFILAGLTAGGGTMGYISKRSVPSLVAGVSVGVLFGLGGYRISQRQPYGIELALLASIILAGSSVPRAIKFQKPLPIGLSALAAFGIYSFGLAYVNRNRL